MYLVSDKHSWKVCPRAFNQLYDDWLDQIYLLIVMHKRLFPFFIPSSYFFFFLYPPRLKFNPSPFYLSICLWCRQMKRHYPFRWSSETRGLQRPWTAFKNRWFHLSFKNVSYSPRNNDDCIKKIMTSNHVVLVIP